jgi:hypothetical protein
METAHSNRSVSVRPTGRGYATARAFATLIPTPLLCHILLVAGIAHKALIRVAKAVPIPERL